MDRLPSLLLGFGIGIPLSIDASTDPLHKTGSVGRGLGKPPNPTHVPLLYRDPPALPPILGGNLTKIEGERG